MSILGEVNVEVKSHENESSLPLYIVKSISWLDVIKSDWRSMMSREMIDKVFQSSQGNLVNSVESIEIHQMTKRFPRVFSQDKSQAVECFTVNSIIKENASFTFYGAYEVPYSLQDKVSREIKNKTTLVPSTHAEFRGVSNAPALFQMIMEQAFIGIEQVVKYVMM